MLIFTRRLPRSAASIVPDLSLALSAEERSRSRHRFDHPNGSALFFQLPRGTQLHQGDLLQTAAGETTLQIEAKPEPVLTVRADRPLALLQAAYHLGNRHVALEVGLDYLRLQPDPVLANMLQQRGLHLSAETLPFEPETGAYGAAGGHGH
ncbi:MAG: urease accessory protein UreE [Synechococcales cyanobacterium RM1_1_8]|nr:urease accessory protein UreE [Synechococcales cyanobacterium RM1_1_8]